MSELTNCLERADDLSFRFSISRSEDPNQLAYDQRSNEDRFA